MQSSSAGVKRISDRSSLTTSTPIAKSLASPATPRAQSNTSPSPAPLPLPPALLPVLDHLSLLSLSKAEWPKDAGVKWRVFERQMLPSSSDKDGEAVMELGRRKVVSMWEAGIWDGLVGSLRLTENARRKELWVFETGDLRSSGKLGEAYFEGLSETNAGHFHPSWLYPCSKCITLPQPCENCSAPALATAPAAVLLPRERYRLPLWMFLVSLRDKIVHGLTQALGGCRIADSFLLSHRERVGSEWESGWIGGGPSMHLTQVDVHLSLQSKYLLVEPSVQPSPYLMIDSSGGSLLLEGSPVRLLPHGYLAYYLCPCEVPYLWTSFKPFIYGLGAGSWLPEEGHQASAAKCWLVTPIKQGPECGVEVIWPLHLVVQDMSRDKLQCLPNGEIPPSSSDYRFLPQHSIGSSSLFHLDVLKLGLTGPSPRLATEASSLDKFTEERALVDRLSADEDMPAEIKAVLGDATVCANFTREAVQAREAARAGKFPEKERERKHSYGKSDKSREAGENPAATAYTRLNNTCNRLQDSGAVRVSTVPGYDSAFQPYPITPIPDFDIDFSRSLSITRDDEGAAEALAPSRTSNPAARFPPLAALLNLSTPSASSSERSPSPSPSLQPHFGSHPALGGGHRLSNSLDMRERSFSPTGQISSTARMGWTSLDRTSGVGTRSGSNRGFSKRKANSPSQMPGRPPGLSREPFAEDAEGYGIVTDDDFAFFDEPPLQMAEDNELDNDPTSLPLSSPLPRQSSPIHLEPPSMDSTSHNVHRSSPASVISIDHDKPDSDTQISLDGDDGEETSASNHDALSSPSMDAQSSQDKFQVLPLNLAGDLKYTVGKFSLLHEQDPSAFQQPSLEAPFCSWAFLRKEWFEAHGDPHSGLVVHLRGSKRDRSTAFGHELGHRSFKRSLNSWTELDGIKGITHMRSRKNLYIDDISEGALDDETLVVGDIIDTDITLSDRSPTLRTLPISLSPTISILAHGRLSMSQLSRSLSAPSPSSAPLPPVAALTPVSPASYPQVQDAEEAANLLCSQAVHDSVVADFIAAEDRSRLWMQDWTASHAVSRLQLELYRAASSLSPVILGDISDKLDLSASSSFVKKTLATESCVSWCYGGIEVAVGLGGAVVNACSPALRFWDKLGLTPVGGQKDVLAYVFYERPINSGIEVDAKVKGWLDRLGHAYMAKGFGRHRAGEVGANHGLVPGQLDRIEAQLGSVIKTMSHKSPHVVFYIFMPAAQLSASAPVLQKLASILSGRRVEIDDGVLDTTQVLVHFLPEEALLHASEGSYTRPGIFGLVATAIYERILRVVSRTKTRRPYKVRPNEKRAIQFPAFTISRDPAPKLDFAWEWPPPTLDLVDPGLLLHVGYCVLPEWLLVTCTDQLGEVYEQRVWTARQGEKAVPESTVVAKVWGFSWKIARRSRKVWRIVIARMGGMRYTEVEAWESLLRLMMRVLPLNLHVSIVSVHPTACRHFRQTTGDGEAPVTPAAPETVTLFADASVAAAGLFLAERTTTQTHTSLLSHNRALSLDEVYEAQTFDASEPPGSWLRPLCTAWLVQGGPGASFDPVYHWSAPTNAVISLRVDLMHHVTSDAGVNSRFRRTLMHGLLQSYQQLTLLAREKMSVYKRFGALPWHLAALCLMDRALSRM